MKTLAVRLLLSTLCASAMFFGAQAEGLYALFDRLGGGAKDFSAILEMFRGNAPA